MQTSATGNRSDRGFTLIELLVVIAVLALLARLSVSAVQPPPGRVDEANAARVQTVLTMARSQSMASGVPTRVWWRTESAEIERHAADFALPPAIRVAWFPVGKAKDRSDLIWFYPDGSATAGELELHADGRSFRLRLDPWGRLALIDRR
jgi:type II secretion system protein H